MPTPWKRVNSSQYLTQAHKLCLRRKIQCHAMQTFSQRVSRKLAIKGKISDNYENEENKLDFGLQKHAYFRWTTGNTLAFVLFWFEIGYGFRGN